MIIKRKLLFLSLHCLGSIISFHIYDYPHEHREQLQQHDFDPTAEENLVVGEYGERSNDFRVPLFDSFGLTPNMGPNGIGPNVVLLKRSDIEDPLGKFENTLVKIHHKTDGQNFPKRCNRPGCSQLMMPDWVPAADDFYFNRRVRSSPRGYSYSRPMWMQKSIQNGKRADTTHLFRIF